MTYQEFQQELQKKEASELYKSLETIREAVRRCSPQTQERLKIWAGNLDSLTSIDEAGYDAARRGVFDGLNDLIGDFQAPGELFAEKNTREAVSRVFTALDLHRQKFRVPRFTEAGDEKTGKALKEDVLDYSAQLLAYMKLGEDTTPEDMFKAMGDISLWKRDRTLRHLMEEGRNTRTLLENGNTPAFMKAFRQEREAVQAQTRTFKECSDEIAGKYRAGEIDYAELEMRMTALRALTAGTVSREQDPVKRSRLQDAAKIYVPEFDARLEQMRRERQQTAAAEAYQQELAASSSLDMDEMVLRVQEVYGAKPVFHPEFTKVKNSAYNLERFTASLPEVDTSGFVVGGAAVSNEEFASLAALAVYDPNISGIHGVGLKDLFEFSPDENVSLYYHSHRIANMADETVYREDGTTMLGPDHRAGLLITAEVGPAREKVREALLAYREGDRVPLAKIIAYGVRCGTDLSLHEVKSWSDRRVTADGDSPARLTVIKGHCVQEMMMEGAMALLERDPELAQAAEAAGLTDEQREKIAGFRIGHQIFRAGEVAMDRLLEAARGGEQLSDFEREQCALALHRRNALMQSLNDHMTEKKPARTEIQKEYEKERKKLEQKYGARIGTDPEAMEAMQKADAARGRKVIDVTGTPPVYRRLGASGVYALDMIAVEQRVGKEKAEWMSSKETAKEIAADRERLRRMSALELAAELGITPPQSGRTTAQDLYDRLTKDYKAGKMEYVLYEARLKAMRELTGGNKHAKIDLETVNAAVEYRLRRSEASRAPLEKAITQMTEATFEGPLGALLRGIYDVYGLTPKPCKASLENGKYAQETFDLLQDFQAQPGETHLKLAKFGPPLNNDDFAVLAAAVTQTYPEIGGVILVQDKKTKTLINAAEQPTPDHAIAARTAYMTDAYRDDQGARKGFDSYLKQVVVPAREKAIEALRQFNGGKGSKAELGKILGTGLHNMVDSFLLMSGDEDVRGDCALEAAVSGRLADIISRDPDLEKEACKYIKKEELETARGLKIVYDYTRAAQAAKQKLKTAAEAGIPLPETEKQACVELMLRQRAMVLSARRHAQERYTSEISKALMQEFMQADRSTEAKASLATMKLNVAQNRCVGIPDYVRMLGIKGPDFAREMLDAAMPGRDAFLARSEAEILAAMESNIGSREDPFQNKQYTQAFDEEKALAGALRHERQKSAPQAGGSPKTL